MMHSSLLIGLNGLDTQLPHDLLVGLAHIDLEQGGPSQVRENLQEAEETVVHEAATHQEATCGDRLAQQPPRPSGSRPPCFRQPLLQHCMRRRCPQRAASVDLLAPSHWSRQPSRKDRHTAKENTHSPSQASTPQKNTWWSTRAAQLPRPAQRSTGHRRGQRIWGCGTTRPGLVTKKAAGVPFWLKDKP